MDEQRRIVCAEIERLKKDFEKQQELSAQKLKESEEKIVGLSKEREQLIRQRDAAIQEANMWRSELAKAREHDVILEAAVVRAEEKVRVAEANAEARIKEAVQRESAAMKEKQELLAYVNILKAQLQRQHIDTTQVIEKTESCSDTKHVDPTEENVDKACLSVSRAIPVPAESVVHMATDQVNIQPVGDTEWSDIQATEARIADVREVAPETDGSSLDIPVVSQP
ncbi:putative switch-associated protein 70-like, partial [Sesbania bispinosa]